MLTVRRARHFVLAAMLTAFAAAPVAAAPAACPTSWESATVHNTAVDFFPHLVPGQFATAAEFEVVISAMDDRDDDGVVCVKHAWGWALNPNSHWYRLGFELGLNEPVHLIMVKDDKP
jgi:hypothetical protein